MSEIQISNTQWRRVEVGRVVVLPKGTLGAIVEIIDHKRALIDGPSENPKLATPRAPVSLSTVALTPIVIDKLPRGARSGTLKKFWEKAEVDCKFDETAFAKKRVQQERRAALTDFDRFKVMRLKKQRRFAERKALVKVKAAA